MVDPEVLRRRVEAAIFTLRKSVITAMRQKLIPRSEWPKLNTQLAALEYTLTISFPRQVKATESEARLPSWFCSCRVVPEVMWIVGTKSGSSEAGTADVM